MRVIPLGLPEVLRIEPAILTDRRGFFVETWNAAAFAQAGIDAEFVLECQSGSIAGALRGLHYQLVQPQGKLVRVLRGTIFDVAVDLRRSSPRFGQWTATVISEADKASVWIPPGFAHAFYVTGDGAEVLYKCTAPYLPRHERTIRWDDPEIGIDWPLKPGVAPILSDKDAAAVAFRDAETYP